jgi:pyridoxal phosphate enzyme (YggS family)
MKYITTGTNNSVLLENIKNIYRKISSAAIRSGRNPFDVKLIAATKTVDIEIIMEVVSLGLRIIGENRVQEAQKKIAECRLQCADCKLEWHMIGHLQKNKAKTAIQLFDLIHSVDSMELARELNKYAEKENKIQRVLLEVNFSNEDTKYGVLKDNLMDLIESVSRMTNLKLEGLMTMPPFFDNPEMARPFFKQLREIRDNAEKTGYKLPDLSMGMTNDFEVAILEGATMVRIGTGIFGERS